MNEKKIFEKSAEAESSEAIVAHNLEMLKGDMQRLILRESIGGNAGGEKIDGKKYPCVAANGFADKGGKIIAFGNFQEMNPDVVSDNIGFTMRIALDLNTKTFTQRMKITSILGIEKFAPDAQKALRSVADAWNAENWPE
jgi:hypothetical protein